MGTNISSPTPEENQAATPIATEPASSNGTANTEENSGEAQHGTQAASATEGENTFTNVDPNSLPPELKSKYDNMLSDYKAKTTAIAEDRKAIESLKQKADVYDRLSSDERVINYVNSLYDPNSKAPTKSPEPASVQEEISDDEWQDAMASKEKFIELQKRIAAKEVAKVSDQAKKSDAQIRLMKADSFVKNFQSRPEYQNFEKYDKDYKLISYQVAVNRPRPDASEKEWHATLDSAYKNADRVYKDIYGKGYQDGLAQRNEQTAGQTEPPTGATPPGYDGSDAKNLSAKEAVDLARRGIRVPNEW